MILVSRPLSDGEHRSTSHGGHALIWPPAAASPPPPPRSENDPCRESLGSSDFQSRAGSHGNHRQGQVYDLWAGRHSPDAAGTDIQRTAAQRRPPYLGWLWRPARAVFISPSGHSPPWRRSSGGNTTIIISPSLLSFQLYTTACRILSMQFSIQTWSRFISDRCGKNGDWENLLVDDFLNWEEKLGKNNWKGDLVEHAFLLQSSLLLVLEKKRLMLFNWWRCFYESVAKNFESSDSTC